MKMKNIIKSGAAFLLAFAAAGCEGYLDQDLRSELAPDNTFTSSLGFEVGINGLYSITRSEYNTWGEESAYMHNGACAYEALQIATDITIKGPVNDASLTPFSNLTLNASTTFVGSYWNWCYSLINSANEVLLYSEKNTNWDYPSDKAFYQAHARFFRAYGYRTLVYLYGDVPYVETILDDFQLNFTRTPKDEVLGHIIDDLEFAIDYLPENADNVEDGKLTKWAALHLISEMYLLNGDYEEAKDAALEVINSGYYNLMNTRFGSYKDQPGDVFSDMFQENNQNRRGSGNRESIWVLQFEYNKNGGGTNSDDWTRRAWHPQYNNADGKFVLADSLGGRGLAQMMPMKWWIGTGGTIATGNYPGIFTTGDIRNSNYNIKRKWYGNNKDSSTYGKQVSISDATWYTSSTQVSGQLYPALFKFFYGRSENLQLTGSYKDRMKFRLAETYLLLAEAYLRLDDPDNAASAVNTVRRRASAAQITADDMTMDFLLDERIRELVGEESRRFTLLRTGKYLERVRTYNEHLKDVVQDYHVLWPIPQTILDSNTGAHFPQNTGY